MYATNIIYHHSAKIEKANEHPIFVVDHHQSFLERLISERGQSAHRNIFSRIVKGVSPEWHGIKPYFVAEFLEKSRIPDEQRDLEFLPLQGMDGEIVAASMCSVISSFSTKVCLIPCHSGQSAHRNIFSSF